MITKAVIERVFCLRYANYTGTCFALDVDGRQYIITAKHVVEGIFGVGCPTQVQILCDQQWIDIGAKLVGEAPGKVDIAVLAPDRLLSPPSSSFPVATKAVYGQDLYFLGFPYGMHSDSGVLNRGYPFPLVRKGIMSNFLQEDDGYTIYLIDGNNNPGFSGGPVIWAEARKIRSEVPGEIMNMDYKVGAVISGYRFEYEKVYLGAQETPLAYKYNTGITIAYAIGDAFLKLIRQNPIGFQIA
jgi:hypothetical protein